MRKYSCLRVFLALPIMGNVLVESCLTGTCSSLPLTGVLPEVKAEPIPISCLPRCSNYDETLFFVELVNAIQGTKVLSGPKSEKSIAPCEVLKFIREMDRCKGCDLFYVVLILAIKDGKFEIILDMKPNESKYPALVLGKRAVTGQGLRMSDDIEVKFPCGATRKVECIKSLKKCSKNVFNLYIYTVRLYLKEGCCTGSCSCKDKGRDCCTDTGHGSCTNQGHESCTCQADDSCACQGHDSCTCQGHDSCTCEGHDSCTCQGQESCGSYFAESRLQTCSQSAPIPGCLITPTNGSSTNYDLRSVLAYYLPDVTGKTASIAIPDDPKKFSAGVVGGVFITEDCKVLGISAIQPIVAVQTLGKIPLANQVATGCGLLMLPVDCFQD